MAFFLVQQRGTAGIGAVFGLVIIVWFLTLAVLGLRAISQNPVVLSAINPSHSVAFLTSHGLPVFSRLASGIERCFWCII